VRIFNRILERNMTRLDLPSLRFEPRIYGVGAWTNHVHFAYDLVATVRPAVLVELGVDRGESYFAFCQSTLENQTGTRCFGIDTWQGDAHAGGYDETTFAEVNEHNRVHYQSFSTLIRSSFEQALDQFGSESIEVLHLDGLHTEEAVRRDLNGWLPNLRPGGVLLLHDVNVRSKGFGVWKAWADLQQSGRSWTFDDGPGLGVWQKPPATPLPGFVESLLELPNEQNRALAEYYSAQAATLQEKIGQQWRDGSIRNTPFAQQTIIQVFYSSDGSHREEDSVYSRVGHGGWKDVRIELPPNAMAAPLRIDFVSALTTIEIASIAITAGNRNYFSATKSSGLDSLEVRGDAERLPEKGSLRLRITGVDPQLHLPYVETAGVSRLSLEMQLRVTSR
jgi:hypothetical protein